MTTFTLTVRMDNAAFDDGMGGREELARILDHLAGRVADTDAGTVLDLNGNAVGGYVLREDDDQ